MCGSPPAWSTARIIGWTYIGIFTLCYLLFAFYAPTAANYRHTYQQAGSVGTLQSQRWSFDFFVTGSISWLVLAPLTMAALLSFPTRVWAKVLHAVVVAVLVIWIASIFVYGAINLANANKNEPSNYHNPFNDDHWCLSYAAPGTPCEISVPTQPPTTPLYANGTAMYQLFWFLAFWVMLLAADLPIAYALVTPAAAVEGMEGTESVQSALLPMQRRRKR